MTQKIGLISFDNWDYDSKIVETLEKKGIQSLHINLGKFKHSSLLARFTNLLSKIFLNKNPKLQKRQEFILKQLEENGPFDQILVISPELIDENYHHKIKTHTKRYIAYLYDSIERFSIEHLLTGVFNQIYSFDKGDCKKYGFIKLNNYNYLEKENNTLEIKYKALTITSFDKRFKHFNRISIEFAKKNIPFNFIFVSRNIVFKYFKYNFKTIFSNEKLPFINKKNKFKEKKIPLNKLPKHYSKTFSIVDLVHQNQKGLSFRVFEAMALSKKLITDNAEIANYEFYNPNNILILDYDNFNIPDSFFELPYEEIPEDIYNKYTISTWVENIFNLR